MDGLRMLLGQEIAVRLSWADEALIAMRLKTFLLFQLLARRMSNDVLVDRREAVLDFCGSQHSRFDPAGL
jgi:hypothetical protein